MNFRMMICLRMILDLKTDKSDQKIFNHALSSTRLRGSPLSEGAY